jgi:hypothetical protein
MRLEIDERYLPGPQDMGPYLLKLLRGGNELNIRWAPWRARDPFPWKAEKAYYDRLMATSNDPVSPAAP